MFKTILVPTDGSALSDKAVSAAIEFAKINGTKIIGLSVAEPYPFPVLAEASISPDPTVFDNKMLELAKQHVQKVENAAKAAGVHCETVTAQSFAPYEEIVNAAKNSTAMRFSWLRMAEKASTDCSSAAKPSACSRIRAFR